MSQAGANSASNSPSGDINQITPDVGTVIIPVAGNINLIGGQTSANTDFGIRTSGAADTGTIQLTNRLTGTVTTSNATPTTIITVTLAASQTSYSMSGVVTVIVPATGDSASYDFQAAFKTSGVVAAEIGTEYPTTFEDTSLAPADITISASGNTVILQVIGVAATTIHWDAILNYRQVV